jgi:hypothetical protein
MKFKAKAIVLFQMGLWLSISISAQNPISTQRFTGLEYRSVGPTRGGRVTAVAGHQATPGTFFMGATGGGLWKTTNGGTTWTPNNSGIGGVADGWGIQLGGCSPSDVSTTPSTTAGQHQPSGALAGEDRLGNDERWCRAERRSAGRGRQARVGCSRGVWCCKGMEGGRTKNFLIQTELNCVNFFDSRPIQKTFIFVDLV